MKKTALILIIFAFILIPNLVRAQEFNFNRAFQDYQFALTTYDQAFKDYSDAKDFYLKNPTLTLKEDARKKTLTMLRDRDQLYIVYLTALRMKIGEEKGLMGDEKNSIFTKIDSEVSWYKDHASVYKDSDPLEDLFNKSKESESRYKTNTLPIAYESLFTASLGEEVGLRLDHEVIYQGLKSGVTNPDPFSRWFTDIDGVLNTLKQNEADSRIQIQKIYTQYYSVSSSYNSAVTILESSLKPLGQLNEFIMELDIAIKNQ